jgi:hypothetical protein
MQSAKEVVREVLDSLPNDCTLDDIRYRLYLRQKLERSARDIDEGRVYTKEEAKEIVQGWFTSSGQTKPSAT